MNVLASFFYCAKQTELWDIFLQEANKRGWNILIDSGAFSAFWQKTSIDLEAYCDFLKQRMPMLWDYIGLDVINNSAESLRNYQRMKLRRLSPMAVLTEDMTPDRVPELMELTENDRVSMGGGTRWPMHAWMARCKLATDAAPRAKLHALGFTRGSGSWRSGCATVDSSTWVNGNRFGSFATLDFTGITQHACAKLRKLDVQDWPSSVLNAVNRFGVSVDDLSCDEFVRRAHCGRHLITCEAWLQFAERSEEMGSSFFFSPTDPRQLLPDMAAAHALRRGDGWRQAQREAAGTLAALKRSPRAAMARAMDAIDEAQEPWRRRAQAKARAFAVSEQASPGSTISAKVMF